VVSRGRSVWPCEGAARLPADARFAYKVGVATPDAAVSSAPIV